MSNVPKSGFERTNVKAKRNKIVKKLNDSIKVEIKWKKIKKIKIVIIIKIKEELFAQKEEERRK